MILEDNSFILLQTILIPAAFSVVALVAGKRLKEKTGWVSFIVLLYSSILLGYVQLKLFLEPSFEALEASYTWLPDIGAFSLGNFTLRADGLSTPVALIITILCTVISIYSIKYMEHEHSLERYFALYLLYAAGMIGTVLVTNLAAFFVFFELMLIPSWALIGVWGTGLKERVAFKYFMFTEAGALSLLAGIVATGFIANTFNIFEISQGMEGIALGTQLAIVVAILLGLFVKMAIFPLHTWLPDAHAEAPTPISALLSPAMIGIGGYALIRIVYTGFPAVITAQTPQFMLILSFLALITMVYGGYMALAQDDIKRLLAYSSISQMGYMLFGIASVSTIGVLGAVLLYVSHGLAKAVLFMVSGVLIHEFKTRSIKELGGLGPKMPYTAVATLMGFLGLMGFPFIIGFWAELYIFTGSMYTALQGFSYLIEPNTIRILITSLAIIGSILTAGYGLWTVRRVFYGQPTEKTMYAKEGSAIMLAPIIVLAALALILGIYPGLVATGASKYISELLSSLIPIL
ncbi:MAG: NADH-quinone oxidoreductase subunit M [Candidatus Methylarchaceae archaeon HK01B]|nr:NADH-quinone oxidoreductase subunit M [Candidatus Methylarchaceae archaeon HK02M1]MCP8319075.1 NADH-quinone oxidoreductase subunit M [Candidatus Methylarchaceae archaeon HK01B]